MSNYPSHTENGLDETISQGLLNAFGDLFDTAASVGKIIVPKKNFEKFYTKYIFDPTGLQSIQAALDESSQSVASAPGSIEIKWSNPKPQPGDISVLYGENVNLGINTVSWIDLIGSGEVTAYHFLLQNIIYGRTIPMIVDLLKPGAPQETFNFWSFQNIIEPGKPTAKDAVLLIENNPEKIKWVNGSYQLSCGSGGGKKTRSNNKKKSRKTRVVRKNK